MCNQFQGEVVLVTCLGAYPCIHNSKIHAIKQHTGIYIVSYIATAAQHDVMGDWHRL